MGHCSECSELFIEDAQNNIGDLSHLCWPEGCIDYCHPGQNGHGRFTCFANKKNLTRGQTSLHSYNCLNKDFFSHLWIGVMKIIYVLSLIAFKLAFINYKYMRNPKQFIKNHCWSSLVFLNLPKEPFHNHIWGQKVGVESKFKFNSKC